MYRQYIEKNNRIVFEDGNIYRICGVPIAYGGGSIIYPVKKIHETDGSYVDDGFIYALKECFPQAAGCEFIRNDNMEVISKNGTPYELSFLERIKHNQLSEKEISQHIYKTGSRILPIIESSERIEIIDSNGKSHVVNNAVTVMESIESKGKSISDYISDYHRFTTVQTFRIIQQLLYALKEVHNAGYLHLDLQDGNIFVRGSLDDNSAMVTLIDFGSARKLVDGRTEEISDKVLFTTPGFTCPEILYSNDGTLKLGPEADIYSIGCLILYMLTGDKYDINTLIRNKTGKYLSRFKLRKIDCPRYLEDRLQKIVAHAIEKNPSDRYHNVDEMICDVDDFLSALQPYRSNISDESYDAFICYKHGDIDNEVAKRLQKKLENTRFAYKTGNTIKKVFLDEGELSSCANFGDQIRAAIKNSEWMILVCSNDTKNSPWVNLEIDTFLEYHDKSHILVLMTEGEPEDIFPDRIKSDDHNEEFFAADARGKSLKEVVKKINGDAFLRIVAPILGVSFDTLKQRQHIYTLGRATFAATFAFAITGLFSAYAINRNHVIDRELKNVLIEQSRSLSYESQQLLEDGDRIGAIEKALDALPQGESDASSRPILPEAYNALQNAMYAYYPPTMTSFLPSRKIYSDVPFDQGNVVLSSDKRFLAVYSVDGIHVYDTDSYTQKLYLSIKNIVKICGEHGIKRANASVKDVVFCDDAGMIVTFSGFIARFDFNTGEAVWVTTDLPRYIDLFEDAEDEDELVSFDMGVDSILSPDGKDVCLFSTELLYGMFGLRMDLNTGEIRDTYVIYGMDSVDTCQLEYSDDGQYLLVGASNDSLNIANDEASLFRISMRDDRIEIIDTKYHNIVSVCNIGGNLFAVISTNQGMALQFPERIKYEAKVINADNMETIWSYDDTAMSDEAVAKLFYAEEMEITDSVKRNILVLSLSNKLLYLDTDSWEVINKWELSGDIICNAEFMNDRIVIILENGEIYELILGDTLYGIGEVEGYFCDAYFINGSKNEWDDDIVLIAGDGTNITVMSNACYDDDNIELSVDGLKEVYGGISDTASQYMVLSYNEGDSLKQLIAVYKGNEREPIHKFEAEEYIEDMSMQIYGNYLYYIDVNDVLKKYDLENGEIVKECRLDNVNEFNIEWIINGVNDDTLVVSPNGYSEANYYLIFDTSDMSESRVGFPEVGRCTLAYKSGAEYAALLLSTGEYRAKLYVYDFNRIDEIKVKNDFDIRVYEDGQGDYLDISPSGETIAVISEGELYIIRSGTNNVIRLNEIFCDNNTEIALPDDDHLIVFGEDQRLSMYDLNEENVVDSVNIDYPYDHFVPTVSDIKVISDKLLEVEIIGGTIGSGIIFDYSDGCLDEVTSIKDGHMLPNGKIYYSLESASKQYSGIYTVKSYNEMIEKAKQIVGGK